MKITIAKHVLLEPLNSVAKASSARSTLPILCGVLFHADEFGLRLVGSDTNMTIQAEIPAEKVSIHRQGRVVLPAKAITDIINKMPNKGIDIEVSDSFEGKISSGKTKLVISGMEPDMFPEQPAFKEDQAFTIEGKIFKSLIRRTIFAVSRSEARPILTGVCINQHGERISFAACDNRRLALVSEEIQTPLSRPVVISGDHLKKINDAITDEDIVSIAIDDSKAMISNGAYSIFVHLIEGTYPNVNAVITNKERAVVRVKASDLLDSIERAKITAEINKDSGFVTVMDIQQSELRIFSKSETGKTMDSLPISDFKGSPIKIACSGKFMIDAVRAADCEDIQIRFQGEKQAIFISDGNESTNLFLIQPIITEAGYWNET